MTTRATGAGCNGAAASPDRRFSDRPRLPSLAPRTALRGLGPPFARRRLSFEDPRAAGESKRNDSTPTPLLALRRSSTERPDLSATIAVTGAAASSRPSPAVTTTSSMLSAQRSPFRRVTFSGVHSRRPRRGLLRYRHATAGPRSVLVGFHHLDGFLLQRGACVLQHAADPRVRPVFHLSRGVLLAPLYPSELSLRPQPPAVTTTLTRVFTDGTYPPGLSPLAPSHPRPPCGGPRRSGVRREDPQGLAPRTGPLPTATFPPPPTRCSHGLA